jgi:hypothetical protein
MFRGGGFAHRGTGITSGLDTPKRGYVDGPGSYAGIEDIKSDAEEYYDLLKGYTPERKPFSRLAAASPALLNLSGALLSGKSYQGGFGGALDIFGQGLTASAPGFAQAVEARRKYEAADPEADLRMKALGLAIENQPKPETETWTGKESFKAKVNVEPTEAGGEPGSVMREITRFTSNLGNIQYRDQSGAVVTDFTPMEKPDTFEGPDKYQYVLSTDGKTATKIEGQGAPIDDQSVKTFQGKDGYQYLIQVDPDDKTQVNAVLLPGQETVENEPTLFKGPNGYTYLLNANNEAELVPGQGAPDKAIKTFKGADGLTYMLDEETKTAVVIPGQAEPKEKLEMFEGPNGIQYQVVDGEAKIIPGQEEEEKEPKQPKTSLFQNEKFKTAENPSGIVSAQFEYDEAKDRWRWTYEAPDGKIKNMPMQGSIEIGVVGPFKDYQSTVNTVKTDLMGREINTRKAIASLDSGIKFVETNPDANTIVSAVASFTKEVKAEIGAALRLMGKGNLSSPEVMSVTNPLYEQTFADLGIKDAVRKAKFLDLAYIVAAARGQTGRALSDKDVNRFIKILGTDSASYPTVVATLTQLKESLAREYAIEHNVYANAFDDIESIPDDFLLTPIGTYREDGKLLDPFSITNDFGALAAEVEGG